MEQKQPLTTFLEAGNAAAGDSGYDTFGSEGILLYSNTEEEKKLNNTLDNLTIEAGEEHCIREKTDLSTIEDEEKLVLNLSNFVAQAFTPDQDGDT